MKTNLYCIYDKIADEVISVGLSKTDGLFVRQNTPYLSRVNNNYINDFVIMQIGQFVDSSLQVENLKSPRVVDWTSYGHPEEKGVEFTVQAEKVSN